MEVQSGMAIIIFFNLACCSWQMPKETVALIDNRKNLIISSVTS